MSNDKGRAKSPWLLWTPSAELKGLTMSNTNKTWLGTSRETYLIIRKVPEFMLFCVADAMLANVGVWDASKCLSPREPLSCDGHLVKVVRAFVRFFWWLATGIRFG